MLVYKEIFGCYVQVGQKIRSHKNTTDHLVCYSNRRVLHQNPPHLILTPNRIPSCVAWPLKSFPSRQMMEFPIDLLGATTQVVQRKFFRFFWSRHVMYFKLKILFAKTPRCFTYDRLIINMYYRLFAKTEKDRVTNPSIIIKIIYPSCMT